MLVEWQKVHEGKHSEHQLLETLKGSALVWQQPVSCRYTAAVTHVDGRKEMHTDMPTVEAAQNWAERTLGVK